ncbi:DUF4252 domain-containing protein [Chitinophaga filiformis]|uniref:DUF4252 domain-containing protein n=1 Tax=Chitinophaga filiformis TaxID=104663 RepID=UPI001F384729|nr:DUF4252 domain-containing protein [Chitinophaga filiformis]MCF6404251.1 DUF4252 domain-containing protein [Chitinophaga filiformis]
MKYCTILVAALLLAVSPAMAQKKSLRKFYREHRGDAFSFRIGVGRMPLILASWIVPASAMKEDGVPLKHLLSKVQKVKVYTISGDERPPVNVADMQQLKQMLIEKDRFEPLIEVRHENSVVHLLNRGKDDELGRVVILVQDETDFVMVNLRTTLHMKDVNMLIEGFAKN